MGRAPAIGSILPAASCLPQGRRGGTRKTARHRAALGVTWLAGLERREQAGAWFATVADPDGNYVQIIYVQVIELTGAY